MAFWFSRASYCPKMDALLKIAFPEVHSIIGSSEFNLDDSVTELGDSELLISGMEDLISLGPQSSKDFLPEISIYFAPESSVSCVSECVPDTSTAPNFALEGPPRKQRRTINVAKDILKSASSELKT